MAHPRATLRAAFVAELEAASLSFPLSKWRAFRLAPGELPAGVLVALGDVAAPEIITQTPVVLRRTMGIEVLLVAKGTYTHEGLPDALDAMAEELEAVVGNMITSRLGGLALEVRLGASPLRLDGEGDQVLAGLVVVVEVDYSTAPGGTLVDAAGFEIEYHLDPPLEGGAPHATDSVDL